MSARGAGVGERGVVLLVALLVLLLLAVIAGTVARTNLLQLQMAGNDEAKVAALQYALAAIDAVLADEVGMSPGTGAGYTSCTAESPAPRCDEQSIVLPQDIRPDPGQLAVAVERMAPLLTRLPVMSEEQASSTVFYRAARFEVRAVYDGTDQGLGRAALVQGVLVRLAAPAEHGG